MSDDVREIKSRIDIVEIIGDYIPLRKAGSSYKGLCPFHDEKTPSFSVSQNSGTFHCFGCGKGGDIFAFVMEMEGMSFREALALLADRAGVKLSPRQTEKEGKRTSAQETRAILESACDFFRQSLQGPGGEAARAYLSRRNLGPDSWNHFGLGWAPPSWDAICKHMGQLGHSIDETVESGLAIMGERGAYDRFKGRIMFPIRDEMAKIAGFGGRLIDGDGPKYLNSPEGNIFNKRRLLYLMHDAKRTIKERKRVILMEGYMDALRAHLSGFTEAVASLGTSLTDGQAALIKRFSDLAYISYDADGAGQEASIRGMYILQKNEVEVRVISLPKGTDPDDLLSSEGGAESFEKLIKDSLPLPLYHVRLRREDLMSRDRPQSLQKAREDVYSGLASLPWLDVRSYIPKIASGLGLRQDEVENEIRRRSGKNEKSAIYAGGNDSLGSVYIYKDEGIAARDRELDLECAFCSLAWRDEEIRAGFSPSEGASIISLFSDEAAAGIVSALVSGESPDDLEERWRSIGERDCLARIARGDAVLAMGELGSQHVEKMVESLRMNMARRRYEQLKPLVLSEEATKEEIAEYHEWAKKLKGGGR